MLKAFGGRGELAGVSEEVGVAFGDVVGDVEGGAEG